jgi:hypothetical protein
MSITYQSCVPVSDAYKENNDCTVKAVAIATNQPYKLVHAKLAEAGRKAGKGTYSHVYKDVMRKMGFNVFTVHTTAKTVTTLPHHLDPSKRYVCNVKGHALAVANGKVEDWSEGRRYRIQNVWEITPIQSKNAIRKAKRYAK